MPSARENTALWNWVVIGSISLPPDGVNGYARVKAPIRWENDKKKAKGKAGARTTTQGRKESPVDIELVIQDGLTLAGESQYDLTQAALDDLISQCPGPFGIANGATDAGRVRDIMIDEISSPEHSDGEIRWSIKANRWDAPATTIGKGGAGCGYSGDAAAIVEYIQNLKQQIATNGYGSPFNELLYEEIKAQEAKLAQLGASATCTPDKSAPTQQYYQAGHQDKPPGVPLGEIQP